MDNKRTPDFCYLKGVFVLEKERADKSAREKSV